jgi:hypothetical protein
VSVVFKEAWRRNDLKQADQARAFWEGLVPPAERERRVKELCCMAYEGDRLVGLSTAYPAVFPQLKARVATYRCAVAPAYRRHELAKQITSRSIAILERWSADNPGEKVLGLAAVIQAPELRGMTLRPTWPEYDLDLNLACYLPTGEQLRVAWFSHARLEPAQPI